MSLWPRQKDGRKMTTPPHSRSYTCSSLLLFWLCDLPPRGHSVCIIAVRSEYRRGPGDLLQFHNQESGLLCLILNNQGMGILAGAKMLLIQMRRKEGEAGLSMTPPSLSPCEAQEPHKKPKRA